MKSRHFSGDRQRSDRRADIRERAQNSRARSVPNVPSADTYLRRIVRAHQRLRWGRHVGGAARMQSEAIRAIMLEDSPYSLHGLRPAPVLAIHMTALRSEAIRAIMSEDSPHPLHGLKECSSVSPGRVAVDLVGKQRIDRHQVDDPRHALQEPDLWLLPGGAPGAVDRGGGCGLQCRIRHALAPELVSVESTSWPRSLTCHAAAAHGSSHFVRWLYTSRPQRISHAGHHG